MYALVLLSALAAAPVTGVLKLATSPMTVAELSKEKGRFFDEYLAQQLSLQGGLSIMTPDDVGRVMGFERQKELMGCVETSCTAELAGALGVEGLVASSIAKVGSSFALTVRVLRAANAQTVASYTSRVPTEEQVMDELGKAAVQLAAQAKVAFGRAGAAEGSPSISAASPAPSSGGLREKAWIPAVVGGAVAAGGAVFLGLASGDLQRLKTNTPPVATPDELTALVDGGKGKQTTGLALVAVGGVGLLVAGGMALLGGAPGPLSASVLVGPGGAGVAVGGTFP